MPHIHKNIDFASAAGIPSAPSPPPKMYNSPMTEKYDPLKSPYHPLKHLAALRYGDKDEVLKRIIHSGDPDNKHKVRTGWWVGVNADLYHAIVEGMIVGKKLRRDTGRFINKVRALKSGDDTPASLRTAAEIAWANDFIDTILTAAGYADTPLDLSNLDR